MGKQNFGCFYTNTISTVVMGGKMRRHGLFLSAEEKIKDQALNKQLDINANLRKTSEHEISSNKKCYQKHGKHISCSKTIILLFMLSICQKLISFKLLQKSIIEIV